MCSRIFLHISWGIFFTYSNILIQKIINKVSIMSKYNSVLQRVAVNVMVQNRTNKTICKPVCSTYTVVSRCRSKWRHRRGEKECLGKYSLPKPDRLLEIGHVHTKTSNMEPDGTPSKTSKNGMYGWLVVMVWLENWSKQAFTITHALLTTILLNTFS